MKESLFSIKFVSEIDFKVKFSLSKFLFETTSTLFAVKFHSNTNQYQPTRYTNETFHPKNAFILNTSNALFRMMKTIKLLTIALLLKNVFEFTIYLYHIDS